MTPWFMKDVQKKPRCLLIPPWQHSLSLHRHLRTLGRARQACLKDTPLRISETSSVDTIHITSSFLAELSLIRPASRDRNVPSPSHSGPGPRRASSLWCQEVGRWRFVNQVGGSVTSICTNGDSDRKGLVFNKTYLD
jgi:hypothetical protein